MGRSREGNGRHRQAWFPSLCPHCGQEVEARRTLPGKPLHIRTHFAGEWPCPPFGRTLRLDDSSPPEAAERTMMTG